MTTAEIKGETITAPIEFWNALKHAYAKNAGDFTRHINEFDPNEDDNHPYGDDLNITDL